MTNKEALLAQINFPVKADAVALVLLKQKLDVNGSFDGESQTNIKSVELALAGLIFIIATSPKSISELDYSISAQDIDELLRLRSLILTRYGEPDELAYRGAIIQDASNLW